MAFYYNTFTFVYCKLSFSQAVYEYVLSLRGNSPYKKINLTWQLCVYFSPRLTNLQVGTKSEIVLISRELSQTWRTT